MDHPKVALVTGSGKRRIGWHVAEALAARGYALVVHYHTSATEAANRRVPAVAIRVVGDGFDEDLPMDFSAMFAHDGSLDAGAMFWYLAGHPHRAPGLVRYGMNQYRALTALAAFLDEFVAAVNDASTVQGYAPEAGVAPSR